MAKVNIYLYRALPPAAPRNFEQSRSSHPEVFCKKSALTNFAKFIGTHLCQSLFFNKVIG